MKFFTKEVKIAIVAIIGLVVLFYGLNFLKGLSLFSQENIYYIKFIAFNFIDKSICPVNSSAPIF